MFKGSEIRTTGVCFSNEQNIPNAAEEFTCARSSLRPFQEEWFTLISLFNVCLIFILNNPFQNEVKDHTGAGGIFFFPPQIKFDL